MKTSIITLIFIMFLSGTAFAGDAYGRGNTRRDGMSTDPYYRTTPNTTRNDNYSTKGNTKPNSGQQGTGVPNPYGGSNPNSYKRPGY